MPSILLVNVYYAPCARIGARRIEKVAAYLQKSGWEVTVLTLNEKFTPPLDHSIMQPANVEVIRTNAFLPKIVLRNIFGDYAGKKEVDNSSLSKSRRTLKTKKNGKSLKTHIRAIKKFIMSRLDGFNMLDEWGGWKYFAVRAIKGRRFDIVLGSYPPATNATIAYEIAKKSGAKLVLDYRDPWYEVLAKKYPSKLEKHKKAENLCLNDARLVMGVSPTICSILKSRTSNKVEFFPAGYTAKTVENVRVNKDKCKYFIYAGTLSYGRSLIPFLKGFQILATDYSSNEIGVIYCGPSSEIFNNVVSQLKLNDYCTDYGLLPKQNVDQLISSSVGVIVIASPGYEFQYQGKIFDTLELGVPLVLIGSSKSDASILISKYHLGWSCEAENIAGIHELLTEALSQKDFKYSKNVQEIEVNKILKEMEKSLKKVITN